MVLEHLTRLDHRLFLKSQGHRHWQRRARLARWVSRTGDGPPYALLGLLLWSSGQPALQGYVQQALQAFAWELPCYLLLKQLFPARHSGTVCNTVPESLPTAASNCPPKP